MKKILALIVASLLMTSLRAEAAFTPKCGQELTKLKIGFHSKATNAQVPHYLVYNKLLSVQKRALAFYWKALNLRPFADGETYNISTKVIYDKNRPTQLSGYNIKIDNNGDESTVTFFFAAGEGQATRLIYAYWSNQSPVNYWVCQGVK